MLSWLKGIVPAVITPFDAAGGIDEPALRSEVDFQISSGVSALCAGGSTGEGAGFSRDDVNQLCSIFVDQAKGRVPVIGGVIADNTLEALELGFAAKEAGVEALQITLPHYLFPPGADEVVSYYSQIREKIGLPIVLYNVLPWALVSADVVGRLVEAGAIDAVKQSGSNLHLVADLVYRYGKRIPILSAVDDLLYPSFVLGAHGSLSAIVSVLPKESIELFDAVQKGNHARALQIHNKLLVVWRALDDLSSFIGRVKYAIAIQGRRSGLPRQPLRPANEKDRKVVREAFQEAGIPMAVRELAGSR